ncbi:MAG: twin-arginine translocase subunit TatC [Acidimicrobiia bacterium]|nr:twin-arginine translocase subunit TatC [Acidimicrobiia bacterium]
MSMLEHLGELRNRIFISLAAVLVGGIVAFIYSNQIINFLVEYYKNASKDGKATLLVLGPVDGFVVRLKVATYGGIVLALPVWLYQLWRFVTPGLHSKEKKYAIPFVLSAIVLFVLGALVAFLTLEPALKFLIDVGGPSQTASYTSEKYISLVTLMIVAFGLSFEFPVVLVFLLIARVLKVPQLVKARRFAIVGIFLFAAIITPSQDPYSLFFLALPMVLFYEGSILIGRMLSR